MTVTGYASDRVLVDADWAKAHLNDPTVRFVEVDVDTTAYSQGHLPGAVGWDWTSQLSDGVRRDLASREDFSELLSQSGIGPDTTIVLYGDNNNWFAAFAYWQLKLFGHDDVRILNGGRKYWLDNGLPITVDEPTSRADRLPAARARRRPPRLPRRHPAAARRPGPRAGRRPLAGRVQRRDHRPARHERDRPARRSDPRAPRRSRGPRRSARTARSRARTSSARCTRRRASRPTRTSSPTAGSASDRATRGSSSTSSSAMPASATTTDRGPSGAA